MPAPRKYDAETQERAVRMYRDRIAEHGGSKIAARRHVGELLGIAPGGDLLARVGGQQLGEQFGALLEGESLSCAQQPTTVDPLDITLASAATRCVWVTRRRTASTISLAFLTR